MRTFLNFFLAIMLLLAFIGSAFFFISISSNLKLEREASTEDTNEPAGES